MAKSTIHCYHHNDPDGWFSAAIVALQIQKTFPEKTVRFIEVNYGIKLDRELEASLINSDDDTIYVVDFCFEIEDMRWLQSLVGPGDGSDNDAFFWIDHHKSALETAEVEGFKAKGIQEIGKAGCQLVWEFASQFEGPLQGKDLPRSVELAAMYDIWDHSDPDVVPFNAAVRATDLELTYPLSDVWSELLSALPNVVDYYVNKGEIISDAKQREWDKAALETAFIIPDFHGLKVVAMFYQSCGSKALDFYKGKIDYDAVMVIGTKASKEGPKFRFSLYSEKPEVDVTANGLVRGHRGAAGSQIMDKLPIAWATVYKANKELE